MILISDDLKINERFMNLFGYTLTVVDDSAKAIQFITAHKFKTVISLPSVKGVSASQICQHVKNVLDPDIYFIAILNSPSNRKELRKAGVDEFLELEDSDASLVQKITSRYNNDTVNSSYNLSDVLESLSNITIIIDRDTRVVDFFKSKNYSEHYFPNLQVGDLMIDKIRGHQLGNLELSEIVSERRIVKFVSSIPGKDDLFDIKISPLNGKYSVISITDTSENMRILTTTIDHVLKDLLLIKQEA